jgi:hypothetical protein
VTFGVGAASRAVEICVTVAADWIVLLGECDKLGGWRLGLTVPYMFVRKLDLSSQYVVGPSRGETAVLC